MGIFGFFASPLDLHIDLEDEQGRRKYQRTLVESSSQDLGQHESCPVFNDGDTISGKVVVRARGSGGGKVEHGGVQLQLCGVIDDLNLTGVSKTFLSSTLVLHEAGTSDGIMELPFNFGALSLPHGSFEGNRIQIRYFLRLLVKRRLADRTLERTLWVEKSKQHPDLCDSVLKPVSLVVGMEGALKLTIELEAERRYEWRSIVRGWLHFDLINTPIISADLCLLRREYLPAPLEDEQESFKPPQEHEFLARSQILDGPVRSGDRLPFRFHLGASMGEHGGLASCRDVKGMYAIKYFLFFELQDTAQRRFFKAHEIKISV